MALTLEQSEQGEVYIIRAEGEIDLYTSPKLREQILKNGAKAGCVLAVDLGNVAYMDSSGVATLVEGLKAASKGKSTFVLLAPSQAVMKVLQLSRLDSVFDIRDTL
jgi:anti-sigma B factor antagonist